MRCPPERPAFSADPIAIMPDKCQSIGEWVVRYSDLTQR